MHLNSNEDSSSTFLRWRSNNTFSIKWALLSILPTSYHCKQSRHQSSYQSWAPTIPQPAPLQPTHIPVVIPTQQPVEYFFITTTAASLGVGTPPHFVSPTVCRGGTSPLATHVLPSLGANDIITSKGARGKSRKDGVCVRKQTQNYARGHAPSVWENLSKTTGHAKCQNQIIL